MGTHKNLMEAYKWFALAAANGDAEAVKRRDLVKLQMPAEVVAVKRTARSRHGSLSP